MICGIHDKQWDAGVNVELPNAKETVDAVLTDAEKTNPDITDVKVTLKVDDKTAAKPYKAAIEAQKPTGSIVAAFFDITMQKTITKNNVAGGPEMVTDVPNGTVTITIPAGKAKKNEPGRIYWPLSKLTELYAGITEDTVLKSASGINPETGGPGKYIPVTDSGELVTLDAPSAAENALPDSTENTQTVTPAQPKAITLPNAGFEKNAFAGTPDAKQAAGDNTFTVIALMLVAAAVGSGVWFWDRKKENDR